MQDCAGDSLGKHNFNALALDTEVCNISSSLFTTSNNFSMLVNTLSSMVGAYQILSQIYNEAKVYHILTSSTTVNLLSSFWCDYEFSIQYPINAINLPSEEYSVITPVLSTANETSIDTLVNNRLKTLASIELQNRYSPLNYPENTIINISFFMYNLVPIVSEGANDTMTSVSYLSGINTFSYNNRNITASFNRDNVHFTSGVILRYIVNNNKWDYIGYIVDQLDATATPNHNIPAIKQTTVANTQNTTTNNTYVTDCSGINENTWYSADTYIYANGFYSGTSSKLGTLTLTFRTPDNQTTVFSHTAGGYDPLTNTGGTDVYLEFDGSVVNAYEQYPTLKTLVKTWSYPYAGIAGINFKYSDDGNGILFNGCASQFYS